MKTPHSIFLLLLALSPAAFAQAVKVTVVPVESAADLGAWLGKPINPSRADSPLAYPGTLKVLPVGQKTELPIVVTGLPWPAPQDISLVADVEVRGADGRSLGTSAKCCAATIAKGSNVGAAILAPWVVVEPEPKGRGGSYTVRVSVSDGTQTWTATQVLPYGDRNMPGTANEAPVPLPPQLRQNVPPSQQEPGGADDKRDCLSLPTPAEVIKCSEQKK